MIGVAIMAYLVRLSGLEMVYDRGALLYADKISVAWYEVFFKAVLCGFMVFIAVDAYRKASHVFFKFIMVVLPISIFIIAGFEHSIANMFYLFLGDHFSGTSLLYILLMVFGNSIGSIILFQVDQIASSKNQTS